MSDDHSISLVRCLVAAGSLRRWMAMQAAVHADRPWAMTVLAALGAAA